MMNDDDDDEPRWLEGWWGICQSRTLMPFDDSKSGDLHCRGCDEGMSSAERGILDAMKAAFISCSTP
jgi:hypothetical protein